MPINLLDKVRSALKRPTSTTEQLAAAVDDARRAETDALAAVNRAQAVVTAGFMDDASKRQTDRNAIAAAREAAEDAALVRAEAERRHAAADAGEEQSRRRGLYESARAEADAAAADLAKQYPKLAGDLVALLGRLARAQAAVTLVNDQLPDGAMPLANPEMIARAVPSAPREVVSDEWVEAWGSIEAVVPLPDEFQAAIYAVGNGWGKRGHYEAGKQSMGEPAANYRRRRFRKITYREPVNGQYPTPLAATITLPAVRGEGMLWGAAFPVHNPALSATMLGVGEPQNVLARIAEIDAAAVAIPVKIERALRVEYPEFVEVTPFPPEQPIDRARSKPMNTGSRFGASPYAKPGARAGGQR